MLARDCGLPLIAAGGVHMHARRRKKLQDALTAIRCKMPLAQCGAQLAPNAERVLRPLARLARLYPAELLLESVHIAQQCTFTLDELRYEYPDELVPAGQTAASHLRALTAEGAAQRYPGGVPAKVQAQIEHELALIARAALRALLPDRLRHRALRPQPRHPLPGPRLGGQLGGLLLPGRHRGRSASA